MHIQPVINSVQAALAAQAGLATADAAIEAAVAQLSEALVPALRLAALELAQQAAAEANAQLPDHTIEIVLVDGDPALRVTESSSSKGGEERPPTEEFDARITLRLPPSLKGLIEDAAVTRGESVNGWVVDALAHRARSRSSGRNATFTQGFDL